jgi:glycosyltransferase involved in cell wall biosynthesis
LTLLTTREEGFGFPLLESLASGTPVVCHRTSALTEIGEGWAHFTDEDTVESFAAKMTEVLENPPDREWRRAASEYARSFTWRRTAREIAEIYRAVAKG